MLVVAWDFNHAGSVPYVLDSQQLHRLVAHLKNCQHSWGLLAN